MKERNAKDIDGRKEPKQALNFFSFMIGEITG
jgi:hypothetical protein